MKTEQEKIDKMAQVLCDDCGDNTVFGKLCKSSKGSYICESEKRKATALVQAGYDDVSEYKAEIERLEEEMSDIRKKTAEEFAKRICEMLWNLGIDKDGNRFSYGDLTSENVLYIAKQFGVDIDNRVCKENNIATAHINKLVEQDAEIERLKDVVKNYKEVLCEITQRKDDAIKWNDTLVDKYEVKIKQAKIETLNEVKKCSQCDNFFPDGNWHRYVLVSDIDILIKEVEK